MTKKVQFKTDDGEVYDLGFGQRVEFAGGAQRTHREPPLGLVPIELLRAVATTRAEGDLKYAPGNWQQGDKAFFVDCLSHAIAHLIAVGAGDESEDHLGHAATNIGFILWALAKGKVSLGDFADAARVLAK